MYHNWNCISAKRNDMYLKDVASAIIFIAIDEILFLLLTCYSIDTFKRKPNFYNLQYNLLLSFSAKIIDLDISFFLPKTERVRYIYSYYKCFYFMKIILFGMRSSSMLSWDDDEICKTSIIIWLISCLENYEFFLVSDLSYVKKRSLQLSIPWNLNEIPSM